MQILSEGLLKLPDRWNLVFTDFNLDHFDRTYLENLSVSLLYLNKLLCHDFLQQASCPSNFDLNSNFLHWLAMSLNRIIDTIFDDYLEFPNEFQCFKAVFPDNTKQRFDEILEMTVADNSNVVGLQQGKTLRVNVKGSVEKMVNETFQVS